MKRQMRSFTMGTLVLLVLAGCGRVTELVLDDSWALEEIRAGDIIRTNLDDYLVVSFDAQNDQATLTVGPAWDTLTQVNVTGTFDYEVDGRASRVVLSQDGLEKHVITFELQDQLETMVWVRWVAAGFDPETEIVSDSATIDYIMFRRQTSS